MYKLKDIIRLILLIIIFCLIITPFLLVWTLISMLIISICMFIFDDNPDWRYFFEYHLDTYLRMIHKLQSVARRITK